MMISEVFMNSEKLIELQKMWKLRIYKNLRNLKVLNFKGFPQLQKIL